MFKKAIRAGIFLSLLGIGVSTPASKYTYCNNQTNTYAFDIASNKADNGKTIIWTNPGLDPVSWNGIYRFSNVETKTGEECYAFTMEEWDKIKSETFYMDLEGADPQIRVTTGWWSTMWTGEDITPGNERLKDNGDGTCTLEINFSGDPILDVIDAQHMLFTGDKYTPINIYFSGGPEPPIPTKEVFWVNPDPETLGPINWNGLYRFGLDGTDGNNECIDTFPHEIWDRVKNGTFYINLAGSEWIDMRITTGWWSTTWTGNDITTGDERLILNEDGTYTLEINFTGDPIQDVLDQQHLLFTGGGYTPLSLYFMNDPEPVPYRVLWDNDHTFKDPSWGGGYRFGFVGGPFIDNCVALFSKEDWDNVIKGGTFYLDIEDYDNDDYFQIHVTDGNWEKTWGDFSPGSSELTRNIDKTWTLKITLGSGEFLDAIENNNLLITGGGYSITRLYCGSKDPFAKQRIWTNPYPNWMEDKSVYYRFAPEFNVYGDAIYAFSFDVWQDIKHKHFYLDLEAKEGFNIRVTTGWWRTTWTGDVISAGSDYLTDNGDGTWTLEIYFENDPIVELLDEQHLLLEGEKYRPLGLRLGVDRSYMSSVNVFKRESTSFKNKAYITTTSDIAWKDTEVTLTVSFEDGVDKFPYELEVTYNDGLRTCELTQVDEDTYTFIMPNFDVDITAYFDTDYVVTFDWLGHGIQPEPQILHEGDKVTMPEGQTFDQDGLVFLGWYQENSCTTVPWDFNNDVIKGNTVLFARWEIFVSAELKSLPTKVDYLYGEDLDLSGGKITVHSQQQYSFTDFTTDIDIIPEMISGYDKYKLGEQVVTINYGDITSTFTVTVTDYISNITMKSNPTKVTYKYGEDLDLAGGKISANMASGAVSDIDITSSMVSGYDKNKLGEQILTVTYEGLTTTFNVNVIDYASSITIKSNPSKTEFYRGEDLDLTGAKITVKTLSGESIDIDVTADMVSGYNKNKLGEQVITITYQSQTATFTITVIPVPLSKGAIATISTGSALLLIAIILLIVHLINRKKNLDLLNALLPDGVTCVKVRSKDDRLDEYVFTYLYKERQMSYYMYKQKKLHFTEAQAKEQFKKLILNGKIRRYSNKYRSDIKKLGC